MSTKHIFIHHHDRATTRRELPVGLRDAKGRAIGMRITVTPVTVVHDERRCEGQLLADNYAAGTELLHVCVQATRGRQSFGARQAGKLVDSPEAVEREIERRLSNMRKRYGGQTNT